MDNPQPSPSQPPGSPEPDTTQTVGIPLDPPLPEQKEATTKQMVLGCGCLALVLLAVVMTMKSCFFGSGVSKPDSNESGLTEFGLGLSESDLKNVPRALDKLTRGALFYVDFEYIRAEIYGPNQDGYFLNVSYRRRSIGNAESTFNLIKQDMQKFYVAILRHPELRVVQLKVNAQLELKHRNEDWVDVYRTRLDEEAIKKLNRENVESVAFEKIWDVVHIHPIFWPFKE